MRIWPEITCDVKVPRQPDVPANILDARDAITELCFLSHDHTPSDIIFTFGARSRPELTDILDNLIEREISPAIMLTGGAPADGTPDCTQCESEFLRDYIREKHGDKINILLETKSPHTTGNIREALAVFDFSTVSTITVIAKHYASQRQLQTLKNYMPGKVFYSVSYGYSHEDAPLYADRWHTHEKSIALVWGEIMRMHAYSEAGYFKLDADVREKIDHIFDVIGFKPE